jgi:tetratricopeptide (TPR) repeat protein
MKHHLRRFLVPLSVLAIAVVVLLVSIRPSSDRRSPRVREQRDQAVAGAVLLKKLHDLRRATSAKEFVKHATGELQDQTCLTAEQWFKAGDSFFQSGFVGLAEHCLRNAVAQRPSSQPAALRLARLLYSSGRVEESRYILVRVLKTSGIDVLNLPLLGHSGLTWGDDVNAISQLDSDEADDATRRAKAWIAVQNQQLGSAQLLLTACESNEAATQNPHHVLMHAICLSRLGQSAELISYFSQQAEVILRSGADLLCLQGESCRRLNDSHAAIRCYWDAFKLSPNHYVANTQLAELLEIEQLPELAALFRERSLLVRDYEDVCRQIHSANFPSEQQLGFAAYTARNLHCLREAIAWSRLARQAYPDSAWPLELSLECQQRIQPTDERFSSLQEWINFQASLLDSYPLPDWNALKRSVTTNETTRSSLIVFDDEAERRGIRFQFEDAADLNATETRLFEFTGGGVGVIDLDQDYWPDLFFTQGGEPPLLGDPHRNDRVTKSDIQYDLDKADQLYRNRRGQTLENVTAVAGLRDGGYSQGCASGDFNNDGFADLFIANIGQNQFFRNNGDGTFSPMTLPESDRWTTSCGIADLTGDGNPDLYEVNHVVAAGVHQRMCRREGVSVPCQGAADLHAEQDRLFAGDGTGAFADITEAAGIAAKDGLGLGLSLFRISEEQGLSVFVANDARPNFLYVHQGASGSSQFKEEGVLRGIALSGAGKAQACMGIAAGDVDQNGTVDFLVTNFFADYNTLYLQQPVGFFQDGSAGANLIESSFYKLGFGSQFLDADLDGDLDLVLTNGDVADFSSENRSRPYVQKPQLLQNVSSGVFEEQSSDTAGTAFQRDLLGRGLARLDWNRDGRPDFAVSHIRSPAMLATNKTKTDGDFLSVRLVGTDSPRIPVGAIVQVNASGRTLHSQLMAGDGYQCCNENQLLIGIGAQPLPVHGTIAWPSGQVQTFTATTGRIILVEGLQSTCLNLRD